MEQTVRGMINVEEFDLTCWPYWIPDKCLQSFFQTAMSTVKTTFGSTLKSLTLTLTTLNLYRYALIPSPVFPTLKHLNITLAPSEHCLPTTAISDLLRDTLVPFINSHRITVESLALRIITREDYGHVDASPQLRGISHFPRLRKLNLDFGAYHIPMDQTHPSGLRHILDIHSNELRELFLNLPHPFPRSNRRTMVTRQPEWYQHHIGRAVFQHLELLSLGPVCSYDFSQNALCLRGLDESLTTLILDYKSFPYHEVEAIVNNILAGYHRLRKLSLAAEYMHPGLFDLFLTKLPNLESLHLKFHLINAPGSVRPPSDTKMHVSLYNLVDHLLTSVGGSFVLQCGAALIRAINYVTCSWRVADGFQNIIGLIAKLRLELRFQDWKCSTLMIVFRVR
jgi:hypothetical protein